jgi:Domain of unknown function (DUF4292)
MQQAYQRTIHIAITLFAFWLASSSSTGCASRKATVAPPSPATTVRPANTLIQKLRAREPKQAKSFEAQARITAQMPGMSFTANATIIWLRDSAVWIAARKFGLEAGRVLITKDSVLILNRLEKTYTARSITALQSEYNMPGDFDLLQHVVLAQFWWSEGTPVQSGIKDEKHWLYGTANGLALDYRIAEGPFWIESASFTQLKESRAVSGTFEQYEKVPVLGYFPMVRTLEAVSPQQGNGKVRIEIGEINANTNPSIKFEVPAHYRRD